MLKNSKNIELLAPVGDMRRLDVALDYGADAVYLAGKKLGMRAACKNFDNAELKAASLATHGRGKRIDVAGGPALLQKNVNIRIKICVRVLRKSN